MYQISILSRAQSVTQMSPHMILVSDGVYVWPYLLEHSIIIIISYCMAPLFRWMVDTVQAEFLQERHVKDSGRVKQ